MNLKPGFAGLRRVALLVTVAFVSLLSATSPAGAAVFRSGEDVNITGPINDDLYVAGQGLVVSSQVKGTVLAAAREIYLLGDVSGDVNVVAQKIVVEGRITGSLRAAANTVIIRDRVDGDVLVVANTFVVKNRATLGRDVLVGATKATLDGSIARRLKGGVSDLAINGSVRGGADLSADHFRLGPKGFVDGGLSLVTSSPPVYQKGSKVGGGKDVRVGRQDDEGGLPDFSLWVWSLLSSLISGSLVALVWPKVYVNAEESFTRRPLLTPAVGAIFLLATPLVALALLVMTATLALPVVLVLLGLYFLAAYLSSIVTAAITGRWLLRRVFSSENPTVLASVLLGVTVLWILFLLLSLWQPLGWLLGLAATFIGSGALIGGERRFYRSAKEAELL